MLWPKGFLTINHSLADDRGCLASVTLLVLVRGNSHVC